MLTFKLKFLYCNNVNYYDADYAKRIIERLAIDLGFSGGDLFAIVQFYHINQGIPDCTRVNFLLYWLRFLINKEYRL